MHERSNTRSHGPKSPTRTMHAHATQTGRTHASDACHLPAGAMPRGFAHTSGASSNHSNERSPMLRRGSALTRRMHTNTRDIDAKTPHTTGRATAEARTHAASICCREPHHRATQDSAAHWEWMPTGKPSRPPADSHDANLDPDRTRGRAKVQAHTRADTGRTRHSPNAECLRGHRQAAHARSDLS